MFVHAKVFAVASRSMSRVSCDALSSEVSTAWPDDAVRLPIAAARFREACRPADRDRNGLNIGEARALRC